MKFSTRARYGLRICFLIAVNSDDCISLATLAAQTSLSEKYLEQIMSKLKAGGIVKSVRGASGGYYLSRSAKDISVNEILRALEDSFEISDCAVDGCADEYCPNKKIFKRLYDGMNSMLDNFSLEDMISDYKCSGVKEKNSTK